jgi:DNA-binding PadR family transcriptional regulator
MAAAMGNSRSFRRSLKGGRRETRPRYPYAVPSLGTVRRWLKQAEADGDAVSEVQHTGKPGRPPRGYRITAQGLKNARERDWTVPQIKDMITKAVHDRKYARVPHLLWAMSAKDPDEARRVAKSLAHILPPDVKIREPADEAAPSSSPPP